MALTWHSRQGTERWGEGGPREVRVRTPAFGGQAGVVKTAKVSLTRDSDAEDFRVANAGVDLGEQDTQMPPSWGPTYLEIQRACLGLGAHLKRAQSSPRLGEVYRRT